MVAAVLFDADGVLVDACELHKNALNDALSAYGYAITDDEHYSRYNGRPTKTKLKMLTEDKGLDPALYEEISNLKQRITLERIKVDLKPDQWRIELLELLANSDVKTALCSNSLRVTCDLMVEVCGYRGLLDAVVGNDDVPAPKPAPDIWLRGAELLGVSIKDCVIVEDSDIGYASAVAAEPLRVVRVDGPSEVGPWLIRHIFE